MAAGREKFEKPRSIPIFKATAGPLEVNINVIKIST